MSSVSSYTIVALSRADDLESWQVQMLESLNKHYPDTAYKVLNLEKIGFTFDKSQSLADSFYSLLLKIDGKIFNSSLTQFSPASKDIKSVDFADIKRIDNLLLIDFSNLNIEQLEQLFKKFQSLELELNMPFLIPFFGKKEQYSANFCGIKEFLNNEKVIRTGIAQYSLDEGKVILIDTYTSIETSSLCRTITACLTKTTYLLSRAISELSKESNRLETLNTTTIKHSIGIFEFIKLNIKFKWRFTKKLINKTLGGGRDDWLIIFGRNKTPNTPNLDFNSFARITPPNDEFWADPFLFEYEGRNFLFLEILPFARGLGHLSVIELFDDGTYSEPKTILKTDFHLSYPNVFEYEGKIYMVPESGDNKTISLYEAIEFPYKWEVKYHLMTDVQAYDVTFHEHNEKWYIFAAVAQSPDFPSTDELCIFHADSPISQDWTPHKQNPVVSDVATARPAGHIYKDGDKLIRPSQDCAGSYGAALNFNEILVLNENEYQEKLIEKKKPDWDKALTALHTINFNERYTVSDAILAKGLR